MFVVEMQDILFVVELLLICLLLRCLEKFVFIYKKEVFVVCII